MVGCDLFYGFPPPLGDMRPLALSSPFLTALLHRPLVVSALWPQSWLPHWGRCDPFGKSIEFWQSLKFSHSLHLLVSSHYRLFQSLRFCHYQRFDCQNRWRWPKLVSVLRLASLVISISIGSLYSPPDNFRLTNGDGFCATGAWLICAHLKILGWLIF